ncbi:MAG: 30S ribosomal protein S20 [Eubacteriales bacterium]|jgi:ribosomal protein S20|nr:30S ribosomal protein S20 [Clostridiales bacterium]MDD7774106.1 30S ribosomal protein S20 [Eubacteriales bacterium]MDY3941083.1 30S ribosomal protein S20 [Eubacteriales bacterium]
MPNIKSAKKRVKVIETKTLQNKMFKNQMRTIVKKYNAALASGNKEEATTAYKAAVKKIDQAVAKGILHKNNAAHKKSEFTLALNKLA